MEKEPGGTLEAALAALERDVEATARAAAATARAIKALQRAVKQGEARKLPGAFTTAEQALKVLGQQFAAAEGDWSFDVEAYLASGGYTRELIGTARRQGVMIFEQDERLYCYPSLLRLLPGEQAVKIDKVREARLRPSVLADHLRAIQQRPARFRPEAFLESLYEAYGRLNPRPRGTLAHAPKVVRLLDVYSLLTILPGQSREYTKAEFARDLYLLDRSEVMATRSGATLAFHASTGTRTAGGTLTVIGEDGRESIYYGISFQTE